MKRDKAVAEDRAKALDAAKRRQEQSKYKYLLGQVERLEKDLEAVGQLRHHVETFSIKPKERTNTSEAVAVIVASDWHHEEVVEPRTVNDLNAHNLTISKIRAERFFQGGLRLWQITKRDVKIDTIVLALLGDFISNDIHDELMETCEVLPMEAILSVQGILISGIRFLLKNTPCNLVIPCHGGNHARTTKKQRHATDTGHSLEWYMYHNMVNVFKDEPRVKFVISGGYHSYLNVYDQVIRFHHGHDIRYQGGVGGLTIPANKAIAQWNKAKTADIDVLGHWHQRFDAGNFLCNGSLIGFNAFALSIKAGYEPPSQLFFLLDKKRGKTIVAPILVED